jgi:N utilization substance protein B
MNEGRARAVARRKARRFALQGLYQIELAGASPAEVEAQFTEDYDMDEADVAYFRDLLEGVVRRKNAINAVLIPILDRPLTQLDPVETCILHIGAYELTERLDVPYRVVINEGVELAKRFGATDSYKYINSILDNIAKVQRVSEIRR